MSWEETDTHRTMNMVDIYHMLSGLALENLAKAILTSRERDKAVTGGRVFRLGTHNLDDLVRKCGLSVSADDRDLLLDLTDAVVWRGRCCIPMQAPDMAPVLNSAGELRDPGRRVAGDTQQQIEGIYNRLAVVARAALEVTNP